MSPYLLGNRVTYMYKCQQRCLSQSRTNTTCKPASKFGWRSTGALATCVVRVVDALSLEDRSQLKA